MNVLRAYRATLKEGLLLKDPSLRDYVWRRAAHDYRKGNSLETALQQLEVLKRVRLVQNMYFRE
jgi:hypothetical protein